MDTLFSLLLILFRIVYVFIASFTIVVLVSEASFKPINILILLITISCLMLFFYISIKAEKSFKTNSPKGFFLLIGSFLLIITVNFYGCMITFK